MYRSFIANNKDFCILTVSELPIKRWLWGEGPAVCRGVWCGAVGRGDVCRGSRASPSSLAAGARREAGAGTRRAAVVLEGRGRGTRRGLGRTGAAGPGAGSCPRAYAKPCCVAVLPSCHVPVADVCCPGEGDPVRTALLEGWSQNTGRQGRGTMVMGGRDDGRRRRSAGRVGVRARAREEGERAGRACGISSRVRWGVAGRARRRAASKCASLATAASPSTTHALLPLPHTPR